MKQFLINVSRLIGALCLIVGLSSCISAPKSSPTPRFYVLSRSENKNDVEKINLTTDMIVGIGPVKIPQNQDRPQIVTQNKDNTLKFSEFNRWGESLDAGISRQIREDIAGIAAKITVTTFPWSPLLGVKYQVALEIVQLDSHIDGDMLLIAQWQVIDVKKAKSLMIKRSEIRQPITPANYTGLSSALSAACVTLGNEIAQALATLEKGN